MCVLLDCDFCLSTWILDFLFELSRRTLRLRLSMDSCAVSHDASKDCGLGLLISGLAFGFGFRFLSRARQVELACIVMECSRYLVYHYHPASEKSSWSLCLHFFFPSCLFVCLLTCLMEWTVEYCSVCRDGMGALNWLGEGSQFG